MFEKVSDRYCHKGEKIRKTILSELNNIRRVEKGRKTILSELNNIRIMKVTIIISLM